MAHTSKNEYYEKIQVINNKIHDLDKKFKKKQNDPKNEDKIQYYKDEIVKSTDRTDKNVKALEEKLKAYTEKIEREIKTLQDKEDIYKKYCLKYIEDKNGDSEQKIHDEEKNELLKERKAYSDLVKQCEQNEEELNKHFKSVSNKPQKYYYQGRVFYSERERNDYIRIDREASIAMGSLAEEEEMKKELEERRIEDIKTKERMRQLEILENNNTEHI